ncbi:DUF2254 domain-containing protein [Streptomyces albipurpureus]|uniref:DUF2254 domain-containing protein n=1 Tax=Streptomyces albipurpureus TaxID=2897419 RepID=A0ABT0UFJ1_9ACTN|nr:DUF2254 domain-containing protein [Streptomyces sp. CWNU-1]MCM2386886.1 DUF2254 domain-containing protein [Streptomyces sp. CWNU-1]
MTVRSYRRPRPLSPLREHLRDTLWFAPTTGLVCVFLLWWGASAVDAEIVRHLQDERAYEELRSLMSITEDAKTIVTTISSAMMTFVGVVFSISLVAVQMASGQLTPRVVRIFVRSRISKLTLTVFLATFLFSLLVLTSYESVVDPRRISSVPVVQSLLTMALVALSLLLFIAYVSSTLRLMQVGPVVDRITREAMHALTRQPTGEGTPVELPVESVRIPYRGRAGVLRDVNVTALVRKARRQGVVLRLIPRIGDFVVPGTPMLAVHGEPDAPLRVASFAVHVGTERTFHQDIGFGLRQLSDIALRALSPAVHDPTTAVQCVDRIVQVLSALVNEPLGAIHHRDAKGAVRLEQDVPTWEDLVDLGLAEIREAAADTPQVTRRLMAAIDDLLLLATQGPPSSWSQSGRMSTEDRRTPLLRHRTLLVQSVVRAVPEAAEREFALLPNRQGIG